MLLILSPYSIHRSLFFLSASRRRGGHFLPFLLTLYADCRFLSSKKCMHYEHTCAREVKWNVHDNVCPSIPCPSTLIIDLTTKGLFFKLSFSHFGEVIGNKKLLASRDTLPSFLLHPSLDVFSWSFLFFLKSLHREERSDKKERLPTIKVMDRFPRHSTNSWRNKN